ncbi:MAG: 3-phosphoshikimate 1-carboxyvinyltransferase [Clostridiales bacterium]|nr:3-phosphoshikimate 1-carboxyvinyltransferase [Clostridiales bacterium]
MKTVIISPSNLTGEIRIPSSKSIGHRAIICAALSNGTTLLDNIGTSQDIEATLEGIQSLGARIKRISDSMVHIKGIDKDKIIADTINCRESGSTLRFLIPITAALTDIPITFIGEGRLGERPLTPYYEIFQKQGLSYSTDDGRLPLKIKGFLKPGTFTLKGNISSQFITGLLFALPLLNADSDIIITTELESKGYIDLTLDILKNFGIDIENKEYKSFHIKGNQTYSNIDYCVEGDFSQAAFWIAAGLLGNEIHLKGLNTSSLQGDKIILDIIQSMGGKLNITADSIHIIPSETHGIRIDASQCPDLVPILAVLGAVSKGTTEIVNAARLRIKESDRLAATASELNKLGADVTETEDSLIIRGKEYLNGGIVDSWNDHRIAMAMAIASIKCTSTVKITNSDAINKSYPAFWDDFKILGGNLNELSLGK